ncbi:hypothetical protein FNL55_12705 [Tardiphaga sp. vice352]|uniref:phage tail length tape measure family protein n=1 Tax=Tardiphaga sp. vice352 TaxID=2592816 RepID=UPI0011654BE2|nr:phage tail length tape measure family protein [Tardiphaga sp. vice352]QDM32099.1 hypothetical protein FNL55_12705 [Tardiphaga sp. vice352]
MVVLNTIRRIEVVGTSSGLDETRAKLDALSRAQTTVATTAEGMAVKTESSSRRQLSAAGAYDRLRSTIDDSFRSSQKLASGQATIDRAFQQGVISVQEQAQAMQQLQARYGTVAVANDNLGKAVSGSMGLARHELINLSRQAQDVAVSLAGGQSPLTVLFQQGSQIGDVFATSQGTVSGFFKQVTSSVGSFLTIGRVAFGGVAASIVGATMALNDYLDSQQKVQMSLLGSGRASGQSVSSINAVAQSSSSLTGFSTAEARAFAAELASTGKIGKANLEPIVKIGHDIATVYGINAVEAARMLGKAFADPAQGAEQLNDRLGFMDAAMQRQIQNLQAQGRLWEAQRVLQAAVASSLEGVSDAVSTSTKFWTALGNTASSAWDKIGAGLSRITGIGLKLGLDEQIATAQQRLDSFKKDLETAQQYAKLLGPDAKGVDTGYDAAIAGVQKYQAEIDKLSATMKRNADATTDAQQRQQSFAQSLAVRNQQPEIDQIQSLRNEQERLVKTMIDVQTTGGPASDILTKMGHSYEELARSLSIANANLASFKSAFQSSFDQAKIAGDALSAFSPGAKAEIARRQSLESTLGAKMSDGEKQALGQQAYENSLKGATIALSEQARARELAANQSVASAQLDVDMVGKSIGRQAEMRANLQARQALEQQLLQTHQQWGTAQDAELARLEAINKKYAERVQLAAKTQINDQIKFDTATIGLTPENAQIAQQLRSIYPEVTDAINSAEAAQMRLNNQLREAKDISVGFGNDMLSSFLRGESGLKSMTAAATNLVAKLASANLSRLLQGGSVFGTQSLMSGAGALGVASAGMAGYQSGSALTGALGGAMAGASFGPVGAVVGGIAGLVGGLFGGNSQRRQQEEQERQQREAAAAHAAAAAQQRIQNLNARLQLAAIDTTTHLGAMQALEVQFQQERLAEAQNGGQAMAQLIAAQDADRLAAEKAYVAEQARIEEEALKASLARMQSFRDRLEAATADTSTLGGALASFEYKAAQERAAEVEAGGQAINDLIAAQEAERFNIYRKFNDASLEAAKKTAEELQSFVQGVAKTITAYLQSLKTGSSSILSPQAQLGAAQSNFNAQLALAQGGNRDALSGITQVAQTLLDQAKSFYASSSGYADIYAQVTAALQGLTGISAGTVASADAQAIIAAVNSTTGAVNTTGASNDNLTAAQSALVAAQNALAAQQVSYLQTQGSLLTAIQGLLGQMVTLNGTSSQQLALLTSQYAPSPIVTPTGVTDNLMIQALNKIVYNTGATVMNTQKGGNYYGAVFAQGGWITGGTPGVDSVPLNGGQALGMPGEFVVRHDIAQANKSWLPEFNDTGRLPQMAPMPVLRAPNDNARTSPANFDWQGLARAIKQISDMSDERSADKSDELTAAIDQLPSKLAAEIRRLLAGTKQRAA